MPGPTREYELTTEADRDLLAIARYTIKKWGVAQARRYETALETCFITIGSGRIRPRVFLEKRPELLFTQLRAPLHFLYQEEK